MTLFIRALGCANKMAQQRQNAMNSWVGSHTWEHIQVNGAYTDIASDGLGGSIYVWEKRFYIEIMPASPPPTGGGATTGILRGTSNVLRAKAQQRNETPLVIQMFTRPNGMIYSWHVDGLLRDTELPVKPRSRASQPNNGFDTSHLSEENIPAIEEVVHHPDRTFVLICGTSNKYHVNTFCKHVTFPVRESIARLAKT